MKKLSFLLLATCCSCVFADNTGIYLGGGIGYGSQYLTTNGINTTTGTPSLRAFTGFQFADWIDAEMGYTYITQGQTWNNIGAPSATIYDISFTPGFSIPLTPVTIYGRVGIDAVSANLNSGWSNQLFGNSNANFVWGGGVKVNILGTRTFLRAEYINFGNTVNNNNSTVITQPSVVMLTAAYVF